MWLKQYPNDHKRFYLFNIRTSEILELDTDRDEIDQIIEILIDNKIKKIEKISDEEFIQINKGPLKLYEINEEYIDISDEYAFIEEN
jgi:hypothetical protein